MESEMLGFFKFGQRDRDGRQKRIEHSGRYLRVSRTGGLSLRAQTHVAGVHLTGNTNHGLRLSTRLAQNTQVAFQNGRFVLRGRYGSDALRLNLSKTGVTASSRTPIGAFNWVRPTRSSVKLGGIQFRGRNAAGLQILFGLFYLPGRALGRLFQRESSGHANRPAPDDTRRARRERSRVEAERPVFPTDEVRAMARRQINQHEVEFVFLPRRDQLALLTVLIVVIGRGENALPAIDSNAGEAGARDAFRGDLEAAFARLSNWLPDRNNPDFGAVATGLLVLVAEAFAPIVSGDFRAETLLSLDDAALAAGDKTLLQETMIDQLAEALEVDLILEDEA